MEPTRTCPASGSRFLRTDADTKSRDAFYTTLCNALDLTTIVFPVTFADKDLDTKPPPHAFRNHEDEAIYGLCTSFILSAHGAPLTTRAF